MRNELNKRSPDERLTLAEAKGVIAEAQAWFTAIAISPAKQALWAGELTKVHGLLAADVREALRLIATREKQPDVFWALEIGEIIAVSKAQMRRRRENAAQDLSRTAIPAKLDAHPGDVERVDRARTRARAEFRAVLCRITNNLVMPEPGQIQGSPERVEDKPADIALANERRAFLGEQARRAEEEERRRGAEDEER